MSSARITLAAGVWAAAALVTAIAVIAPGDHLPTGDGAHILAAAWRISTASAPLDDLLHRITPHPPLAYLHTAVLLPWMGVRTTMATSAMLSAGLALVGLRWLRPETAPADHLVALSLLVSSGGIFSAVDQHALDWPAAAVVLLALGGMVRASDPAHVPRTAGVTAASLLLAALFMKYTGVFALAGGIAAALALGAWRRKSTWIAAAIVAMGCTAWGLWAMDDLAAYGATTIEASGAGGPSGAVNRDPDVTVAQRLSIDRLRLWACALRDTLGWVPLTAIFAFLAMHRVRTFGSRIALAASVVPMLVFPLLRIQPQPRYMLLTAVLLVAAALPTRASPRRSLSTALMGGLAVLSLVYSVSLYTGLAVAERPGHRSATPTDGLGDWPWPARSTWPTRSRIEAWGTRDALQALDAHLSDTDSAALVRFGVDPDRPSWAAIDLVARADGIHREWVVAESPRSRLPTPPGMSPPTWAWVSWTDASAAPALAWVQTHANLEGAITWWASDGTGGVVLPLGGHHH